jgi:uncharacterized protein (DUF58 family)
MPTRDAYAVALLALLIFFVAFNLQSGWVYAVDALLVALIGMGWLSARHAVHGLSAVRTLPTEAVEGDAVGVGLTLRATGPGRRYFVEALDAIPGLQPAEVFVPVIAPGREVAASYLTAAVRRGIHHVRTTTARSAGLTGLFVAHRDISAPGDVTVYPRYWKISRFPPAAWTPAVQPSGAARRRGGMEFYGLRDYRSGDSVRHVHWRSSARRGTLMVREFEEEMPGVVTLLMDTRPEVQEGAGTETTFEDLIRAAASITWYVTSRGGTVRLLAATRGGHLDLTAGWRPAMQILAQLQPEGRQTPAALLSRAALGTGVPLVVLTPDAAMLRRLAASGARVAGVVADPGSYAEGTPGLPERTDGGLTRACVLRKGDNIGARLEQGGG